MSRSPGAAGSPVLIGAATLLVVLVAVFLAYNANRGLPFVPTYQLNVEVPSAANLARGNDVRIGGARVGAIDRIRLRRRPDGSSVALLTLKVQRSVAPLPTDSTVLIRPRSVLGLKYVQIRRGSSSQGYLDGATVPLRASRPAQVELDEVVNTLDAPTRAAARASVRGFGDAFAGRGASVNQAIGELRPLLRDAVPVARALADPRTRLARLIAEARDFAAELAPVAEEQARLFAGLDRTFAALRRVARPSLQEAIAEAPGTLAASARDLRDTRPLLAELEGLARDLRPGVRALRPAAPALASALRAGTPTLRRSPALSARLGTTLASLGRLARDPLAPRGVSRLAAAAAELEPTLTFIAPAQTTCNLVVGWFRNIASLLSEGDSTGTWERFIIIATPSGPDNEGGPSTGPANGPTVENHLHSNPYPHTAAPGQPHECEAGNEPFIKGRTVIGNVPGTQPARTVGSP